MEDVSKCDTVDRNDGVSKCSGRCGRTEEDKYDDSKKCQQAVDSAKRQQADDSAKRQQADDSAKRQQVDNIKERQQAAIKSQIDSNECDHFYTDFYPFSM